MPEVVLDPDDEKILAECRAADAVLVTWDRVVREAAGGVTPYEALDRGLAEGEGTDTAKSEVAKLRKLSPIELTVLADGANQTWEHFRKNIRMDHTSAHLVKQLRCDEGCSWRAIARWASQRWHAPWGSNQLAGMVICEKAAQELGEDFMKEPWN